MAIQKKIEYYLEPILSSITKNQDKFYEFTNLNPSLEGIKFDYLITIFLPINPPDVPILKR